MKELLVNKSTILLAGLAVLCAVPATAQLSVPVSFAGLDLTSAEGKAVLNRRIIYAIREVCGQPDSRDLAATRMILKCKAETMQRTQPRVAIAVASARPNVRVAAQ